MMNRSICYTTIALGYEYRQHAKNLAGDIEAMSPQIPFVILTDRPKEFGGFKNVIALKHRIQSVGLYHDKLFCFGECLEKYETVIFLDADCRMFGDFSATRNWKEGLTAISCCDLLRQVTLVCKDKEIGNMQRQLTLAACAELDIDMEKCKFVFEGIFVLSRCGQSGSDFVNTWKQLRDHFELHGLYDSEGISIGLAAQKSGLQVYHYKSNYSDTSEHLNLNTVYKDKLFYKYLLSGDDAGLSEHLCQKLTECDSMRKKTAQIPFHRKIEKKIMYPFLKSIRALRLHINKKKTWSFNRT